MGLALATPVLAQDETEKSTEASNEAVEILKKADAATKAVNLVRYNAAFEATGEAAARAPKVEGTVVMAGDDAQGFGKYRVNAKGKLPGSEDPVEFSAGTDGETYFLIDPAEKTVYADMDSAVLGQRGRIAAALLMREFVHPTPFSDEINADKAELKDAEKIGDQDCYVIHVVYKNNAGEAIWTFGKNDYLPRRVVRVIRGPSGEPGGEMKLTLTELDINPSFVKSPFDVEVPEGFTKTDDFAP
jgi:hypothetical protein